MRPKAVFLDRDGTIAKDVPYCSRAEDFELLPTVARAVRLLNENGFLVVVVTNQSGLARGYFTEETLGKIHEKMKNDLARNGARVDAIYYCPHHPDDGCQCRKPRTGLFSAAATDLNIDFNRSYVVGDMPLDIEAGKASRCKTVLLTARRKGIAENTPAPDHTASSLLEAAEWILKDSATS